MIILVYNVVTFITSGDFNKVLWAYYIILFIAINKASDPKDHTFWKPKMLNFTMLF